MNPVSAHGNENPVSIAYHYGAGQNMRTRFNRLDMKLIILDVSFPIDIYNNFAPKYYALTKYIRVLRKRLAVQYTHNWEQGPI